jgi:FkbM family methyltransferase
VRSVFRTMFRRYATHYPLLFNAQQRYSVLLKDWIGHVHEDDFHALRLFRLRPNSLCVDIGANKGQSVTSIKSVLPDARIVSFEPNPSAFAMLKTVATHRSDVTAYNIAVGMGGGVLEMWIPRWRGISFDQLASSSRPDAITLAAEIRGYGFPLISAGEIEFDCVSVEITTLDALALQPDFVKIDVEGGELDILRGAQGTLRNAKPLLMIERGHRQAISDFLSGFGYTRCTYADGALSFDDRADLNSLFAQASHLSQLTDG